MRGQKRGRYGYFDAMYRFFGIFAMYLLPVSFFLPYIVHNRLDCMLISFICFVFGYAVSFVFSRIFGFKRKKNSLAYESNEKYFELHKVILPVLLSLIFAIIFSSFLYDILNGVYNGIYSGLMLTIFPLNVIAAVMGSILWFYPTERISSERSSFYGGCIIMVAYIWQAISGLGAEPICVFIFALYTVSSIISLSYVSTIRSYGESTGGIINDRVKFNCLRTSGMFFGICALCFTVLASVFSGIAVIFKGLLAGMFVSRDSDGIVYEGAELQRRVNKFVYGSERAGESPLFYFFILFLIITIIGLFILIFGRHPDVKKFFKKIKDNISEFLKKLCELFRKDKKASLEYSEVFESYRDREKKIVPSIRDYNFGETREVRSFKSFESELQKRTDESEKLRYSYVTLIGLLRKQPLFIRKGDSPSEISAKLCSRVGFENIEKITRVYEKCAYSDNKPNEDGIRCAIIDICSIVKKYMECKIG